MEIAGVADGKYKYDMYFQPIDYAGPTASIATSAPSPSVSDRTTAAGSSPRARDLVDSRADRSSHVSRRTTRWDRPSRANTTDACGGVTICHASTGCWAPAAALDRIARALPEPVHAGDAGEEEVALADAAERPEAHDAAPARQPALPGERRAGFLAIRTPHAAAVADDEHA